ncbi:MAG: GMC family oxidoreductase [Myxococcota bacterium]|nr:GMC family oxidoreductase [Myxococcota bacterium]
MTTKTEYADVVIVGSGAGGATLGGELAEAGEKVVFLEAGNDLDITYGSPNHYAGSQFFGDTLEKELFWHEEYSGFNWRTDMGECAGGGTSFYGGVLEESSPEDFEMWPFSFQEFMNYINLTKQRFHVSRWPVEEQSPYARLINNVSNGEFSPIQSAFNREPYTEYGVYHDKCRQCRFCLLGCKNNAKASAISVTLPKARWYGAEVRDNSLAVRINTDWTGSRVTSITYLKRTKTSELTETLELRIIYAKKFILAAGTMMTPMLLHWSGRNGEALANSSGQVGKNLRGHFCRHTMGVIPRQDLDTYKGQVVELSDQYRNYDKGYLIEFNMAAPPAYMGMLFEVMTPEIATKFIGVEYKRFLRKYGQLMVATPMARSLDDGFTDNSVLPHPSRLNKYGLPLPHVHLVPNTQEAIWIEDAAAHAKGIMQLTDADPQHIWSGRIDAVHKKGTCRMGTDPSDSVTDLNGQCWDLDNLWIADGSLYPAPLMANCAFIIYALAYKIADGMLGRQTIADSGAEDDSSADDAGCDQVGNGTQKPGLLKTMKRLF